MRHSPLRRMRKPHVVRIVPQRLHTRIQIIHLFLQRLDVRIHLAELVRVLEASIRAAVRRILAFEIEVSASQAWGFPIAFDFASFAFVAGKMGQSAMCLL